MVYIYDILLNFNKVLYEFFEWEDSDDIKYIKKIPVFKVNNKVISDFISNNIKVCDSFLSVINNKTKYYDDYIEDTNLAILSDGVIAIGVNFDNGEISRMLLAEEDDVLNCVLRMEEYSFDYVLTSLRMVRKCSRECDRVKKYIMESIDRMYKNNEMERLSYYYLEYFNKISYDIDIIYNGFVNEINNNYTDKFLYLKDLISLTNKS